MRMNDDELNLPRLLSPPFKKRKTERREKDRQNKLNV